jgi:hypothetical protein
VVNSQRIWVDIEIEARGLLVAYATSDQDPIGCRPKCSDAIFPIMQHLERPPLGVHRVIIENVVVGKKFSATHSPRR